LNKIFTFFFFVGFISSVGLHAQDTHFSQFYASPLNLNPALTGSISDGNFRATGIYRNQDRSFTTPYVTYSASFDMKLLENLIKNNDVFAVGAVFLGDRSGDGVLSLNSFMGSASYHKSIGKEAKHFIGIGIQGGYIQKSVNGDLTFPKQWSTSKDYFDPTQLSGESLGSSNKIKYFDLNAGLLYQGWIKKDADGIFAGVAFAHLTSPKQSFLGGNVHLPLRYTIHAGAYIKLSQHFYLTPNIMFLYQDKAMETDIGTAVEYHKLMKKTQFIFFMGVWTRLNDVFIPSAGIEYYRVRISCAYDVTTSSLSYATQNRSAFELAIIYTGFIKPKEIPYPKLVPCPRM
jgi:type IX secretion system PorP/SprF family membrane protein